MPTLWMVVGFCLFLFETRGGTFRKVTKERLREGKTKLRQQKILVPGLA